MRTEYEKERIKCINKCKYSQVGIEELRKWGKQMNEKLKERESEIEIYNKQ